MNLMMELLLILRFWKLPVQSILICQVHLNSSQAILNCLYSWIESMPMSHSLYSRACSSSPAHLNVLLTLSPQHSRRLGENGGKGVGRFRSSVGAAVAMAVDAAVFARRRAGGRDNQWNVWLMQIWIANTTKKYCWHGPRSSKVNLQIQCFSSFGLFFFYVSDFKFYL